VIGANIAIHATSWAEERTLDEWVAALKDQDWKVRQEAAVALERMKRSYAVSALMEALKDDVPEVRAAAASALGALNDPYAIEPLIGRLKDDSPDVRNEASASLGQLTGQGFKDDYVRWKEWWSQKQGSSCGY
jgi:HEAT repeat protein